MIQWQDEGIVISTKLLGERQVITTLLTKEHGLHKGVFRPSKATKPLTEPGTVVQGIWKARLSEHLGSWTLEPLFSPLAFVLHNALALKLLNSACALLNMCLPEREAAPKVHTAFLHFIHQLEESAQAPSSFLEAYCYFELFLLKHTGISLDFKTCAATGGCKDLIYVSPRSGRAVSKDAGEPYKEKLLPLPAFLQHPDKKQKDISVQEILAALALSGYFLSKYVFVPHELQPPAARQRLLASVTSL